MVYPVCGGLGVATSFDFLSKRVKVVMAFSCQIRVINHSFLWFVWSPHSVAALLWNKILIIGLNADSVYAPPSLVKKTNNFSNVSMEQCGPAMMLYKISNAPWILNKRFKCGNMHRLFQNLALFFLFLLLSEHRYSCITAKYIDLPVLYVKCLSIVPNR